MDSLHLLPVGTTVRLIAVPTLYNLWLQVGDVGTITHVDDPVTDTTPYQVQFPPEETHFWMALYEIEPLDTVLPLFFAAGQYNANHVPDHPDD